MPVLQPLSAAAAADKIYLQMFLLLGGRIICFVFVRPFFVLVPLTRDGETGLGYNVESLADLLRGIPPPGH